MYMLTKKKKKKKKIIKTIETFSVLYNFSYMCCLYLYVNFTKKERLSEINNILPFDIIEKMERSCKHMQK